MHLSTRHLRGWAGSPSPNYRLLGHPPFPIHHPTKRTCSTSVTQPSENNILLVSFLPLASRTGDPKGSRYVRPAKTKVDKYCCNILSTSFGHLLTASVHKLFGQNRQSIQCSPRMDAKALEYTMPFQLTKTIRRDPYDAILPKPNAAQGKVIVITGAGTGIGAVCIVRSPLPRSTC